MFNEFYDSFKKGELILVDSGMCRWHLRKNGQITIYEIITEGKGQGTEILEMLKKVEGAKCIVAKCPIKLESNKWYDKKGFNLEKTENNLNHWRLDLG